MIVVEGPDGAGKTTFVEKLAERLEMPVVEKAVGHEMEGLTDIQTYVEKTLAEGFQPKIFDRFALISGCIYDPVFTGMTGVNRDFRAFDWLTSMQNRFLEEIGPVIIWCLPPLQTMLDNLETDPLNSSVADQQKITTIYWLYHCRAALEPSPILYDYTTDNIIEVFEEIEMALEERDAE